jgi:hypothetical protein
MHASLHVLIQAFSLWPWRVFSLCVSHSVTQGLQATALLSAAPGDYEAREITSVAVLRDWCCWYCCWQSALAWT